MSRDPEEVNKLTESTYKNVMEQFNPGLRNLINLGKNYEKAVNAMVVAGRSYYDSLAKIGDISADSPVSKELGQVLVEISRTHKKLNDSLEESFKKFHKEIISELEKKTDLDVKYMTATLKRYQTEHRNKLDSLEKSQAELKKIRRKSQGARNVMKYEHKEMEYLETVSSRQTDIQRFIAEGCREALLEEKRRFCFLVDKHCSFTQHMHFYHAQCAEFLNAKLPGWQEVCSDATKVPEKVKMMIDEIRTPGSTPISGTPQPSPMIERNTMIGNNFYAHNENASKVPPAPVGRAYTSPLVDMFNNPATGPKVSPERPTSSAENSDDASLSRSTSVATGLNIMKRQKVKTIFPHTAGNNKTLLSFAQGDTIILLVSEEKDGWLYGEHESTKVKGWFPSSYTRPLEETEEKAFVPVPSAAPVRSISSVNLAEKAGVVLPPPDYLGSTPDKRMESSKGTAAKTPTDKPESAGPTRVLLPSRSLLKERSHSDGGKNHHPSVIYLVVTANIETLVALRGQVPLAGTTATFRVIRNLVAKPDVNGIVKPPFLSGENPFATVKLRPTVTNDRSAPIIR